MLGVLLQFAHDTGVPHIEPGAPAAGDGKGASTFAILVVFLVSAAVLGLPLVLRRRVDSSERPPEQPAERAGADRAGVELLRD